MYLWEYTLIYLYICICEYAPIYLYAHTYLHLFIHVIGNKEVVRRAGKVCMSGSEDDIAAAVMLLDADLRGSELFQGINQASGGALFARKGANGQDIKTAPTKTTQAAPTPPTMPQPLDSFKQPQGTPYQPQPSPPTVPKLSQAPKVSCCGHYLCLLT
jgi:hypothetical protein